MIRRPTCAGRLNATEPKFSQIEGCNEGVNHANRIVICNPVVQAFRQQSRLPAISSLNETSHASPRRFSAGIIAGTAFSHMGVIPGSEPYSGSANQLSRTRRGLPQGLAMMERGNGALCRIRRVTETDFDLHRRSDRKGRARRGGYV